MDITFIINKIQGNFDFTYMIIINILTYLIIKFIDYFNGDKTVSVLIKRIILVLCIILITILYLVCGYKEYIILINSAIAAPIFYSWVLRPIITKLNIGYKQLDDCLKIK